MALYDPLLTIDKFSEWQQFYNKLPFKMWFLACVITDLEAKTNLHGEWNASIIDIS